MLVINIVDVLQHGQRTNFANDSGKQSVCYLSIVPDDQELA